MYIKTQTELPTATNTIVSIITVSVAANTPTPSVVFWVVILVVPPIVLTVMILVVLGSIISIITMSALVQQYVSGSSRSPV